MGLRRPAERRRRRFRPRGLWNWTAFAAVLAALASAASVYFTGQSLDATRAQVAVTEQSQFTDRFTKAVDQLDRDGPEHLQARLGAIYALERLARDSPRDQPVIVEVLAAFIRTTAPQANELTLRCPEQDDSSSADLEVAITVLGRRDPTHDKTVRIDLQRACVESADLTGANFANAHFYGAHLGSGFDGADLSGADLSWVDLTAAHFRRADLSGAALGFADLTSADFRNADLRGAELGSADLNNANLRGANLSDAYLASVNFTHADLRRVDFTGADLDNTVFRSVDLRGADLSGAQHDNDTVVADAVIDGSTKGVWWR